MAGKKDFAQQAYELIKKRIINCEYKPNSFLNEGGLASELGISRTPAREAIIKLEKEGFLQIIPKKGIYITAITVNDIMQIFQARKEIEPLALRMGRNNLEESVLLDFNKRFSKPAMNFPEGYKIDTAMHMYIVESCRNNFIISMMKGVFEKNTRVIVSSWENQCHVEESRKEHLEILDFIMQKNYEEACEKLVNHIGHCRDAAL
ncbi:MAG: GntR family transcriptional regulator, partial [Sphaerochaetaceae bacterium]|nr:GntR family transcriptional regulator [Sphaerochaetaceae bacterium]